VEVVIEAPPRLVTPHDLGDTCPGRTAAELDTAPTSLVQAFRADD
jgi:hypothetical protein